MFNLIKRGAEAEIYETETTVIKRRVRKEYRIVEVDEAIRRNRTRKEAKMMEKMGELGIAVPRVVGRGDYEIEMEKIVGESVKEVMGEDGAILREVGEVVYQLHESGVIHGDLTTMNFIVQGETGRVYVIDFGLGFYSNKNEDKAVDLYLLEKSLAQSNGRDVDCFYQGYFGGREDKELRRKLDEIRGRKR
ncbi:BUD32 [Enterospora canceri]|uniref:non-specific serine/threonine protein kinase n=1 Tax=Enterospora canceri TaxID=1081671 RepID=A0A1Y1S7N6_9MICR|nr:BUD32 [Enterospora canceri]